MVLLKVIFAVLVFTLGQSAWATSSPKVSGYHSGFVSVDKAFAYRTSILNQQYNFDKSKKSTQLHVTYSVGIEYVFKWELSILMGEPVVIGWLAYKPTSIVAPDSEFSMLINHENLLKKIRISELKMKVILPQKAAIVIDTGVAWKPYLDYKTQELLSDANLFQSFQSYNVAGSPNWDKLFVNITDKQRAKQYFMRLTTRKQHIDMVSTNFKIIKLNVDTSAIDKYIYAHLQKLEQEFINLENKALKEKKRKMEQEKKAQDKERRSAFESLPFESQVDVLIASLEEEKPLAQTKELQSIEKEITRNAQLLLRFETENKTRITSLFAARKDVVSHLPRLKGLRVMKHLSCEYNEERIKEICPQCNCNKYYNSDYIFDEDFKLLAGPYKSVQCFTDICVGKYAKGNHYLELVIINEDLEEIRPALEEPKVYYIHNYNGQYGILSHPDSYNDSIVDRQGRVVVKNVGWVSDGMVVDGKVCLNNYDASRSDNYPYIYSVEQKAGFFVDRPGQCRSNIHDGKVVLQEIDGGIVGETYFYDVEKRTYIPANIHKNATYSERSQKFIGVEE